MNQRLMRGEFMWNIAFNGEQELDNLNEISTINMVNKLHKEYKAIK